MLKLKAASTKVVDLNGAFAMPGFNDAHTHIAGAGQQHLTVDLIGAKSLAEMQSRIRSYVADPAVSEAARQAGSRAAAGTTRFGWARSFLRRPTWMG